MAEPQAGRPRLAPGVRLHFDKTRKTWVLLSPERVIEADGPAPEVIRRIDGSRTVDAIIDELAALYTADRAEIAADVRALIAELQSKRLVLG